MTASLSVERMSKIFFGQSGFAAIALLTSNERCVTLVIKILVGQSGLLTSPAKDFSSPAPAISCISSGVKDLLLYARALPTDLTEGDEVSISLASSFSSTSDSIFGCKANAATTRGSPSSRKACFKACEGIISWFKAVCRRTSGEESTRSIMAASMGMFGFLARCALVSKFSDLEARKIAKSEGMFKFSATLTSMWLSF